MTELIDEMNLPLIERLKAKFYYRFLQVEFFFKDNFSCCPCCKKKKKIFRDPPKFD